MCKVYGYCRISTAKQSIDRQVRNILAAYPNADIRKETYTGTKYQGRKELKKILDKAKESYGRYSAVNLCNHATIEFRLFRGTLKYNTLIATLQMVNRICEVAFSCSDEEMQHLSWSTFVTAITEPELIQYLKERRLYVNEEITPEEEL